jgi:cytochrome c
MFISRMGLACALACAYLSDAVCAGPALGRNATEAEVSAIDISIPPSGAGLPAGSGTAKEGATVYAEKCAACHGEGGKGKPADRLVGGLGSLASGQPVKTVNSYWPYATTLFDYIRRAMPYNAPMSLANSEVYAVTAYILAQDKIIGSEERIDAATLPKVKMPNRDGFVDQSAIR